MNDHATLWRRGPSHVITDLAGCISRTGRRWFDLDSVVVVKSYLRTCF